MKISSLAVLLLAALPSVYGQGEGPGEGPGGEGPGGEGPGEEGQGSCPSLCADGSDPGNTEAILPVPLPGGGMDINCGLAATLLPALLAITPEQCTAAQAAAFLVCECPTAPAPDVSLPCAFCADGSLPADEDVDPPVPITSTGGEIEDCIGLAAYASTLTNNVEDTATCATIQTYSTACGCPAVATDVPEEATTVVEEPETTEAVEEATTEAVEEATTEAAVEETTVVEEATTTGAPVEPETTEAAEPETTTGAEPDTPEGPGGGIVDPIDPLVPTASPAPSMAEDVDSNMPTSGDTGTQMPAVPGGTEPTAASILTPFPTAEPTSAGYAPKSVAVMCGLIGVLVAIM